MRLEKFKECVMNYCPFLNSLCYDPLDDDYSWAVKADDEDFIMRWENGRIYFPYGLGYDIEDGYFGTDKDGFRSRTWTDGCIIVDCLDENTIIDCLKKMAIDYKKLNVEIKKKRIEMDF